jgi:hypothetical protein
MNKGVFSVCVLIALCYGMALLSQDVIRSPKGSYLGGPWASLSKIGRIGDDLGGGEYLFNAFSLALDKEGAIYVYDNYWAKIFKFSSDEKYIRSFGSAGGHPGGFSKRGKTNPVFLKFGTDERLYAHEVSTRRIISFDKNGDFLSEMKPSKYAYFKEPTIDASGNVLVLAREGQDIAAYDQNGLLSFKFAVDPSVFSYLFLKPPEVVTRVRPLSWALERTDDSGCLIYLFDSASLIIIKRGTPQRIVKIWPEQELAEYKLKIEKLYAEKANAYRPLFPGFFVDNDDRNLIYLQFGANQKGDRDSILEYNSARDCLRRLFVDISDSKGIFLRFVAKANTKFYAIENGKILIYKEA